MAKTRLQVAVALCAFAAGLPLRKQDDLNDGPDLREVALEQLYQAQQDLEELTVPWLAAADDDDGKKLAPETVQQYARLVEQFFQEVGDPKDPEVIAKVNRSVEADRARRAKHRQQAADNASFEATYAQRLKERDARRARKSGPGKR